MAQLASRPRNEVQFLSEQDLVIIEENRTGNGVFCSRTIPDGQTFVLVDIKISAQPLSASKAGANINIEFDSVVSHHLTWPIGDSNGDAFQWPTSMGVKGLKFEGDGVKVFELRIASASSTPLRAVVIGYDVAT